MKVQPTEQNTDFRASLSNVCKSIKRISLSESALCLIAESVLILSCNVKDPYQI